MSFKGKCAIKLVHGLPKLELSHKVSSKVIKSLFMVEPQLVKIGGPWTRCMIRGSMDPVHERGSMDPHGPGPQRGSMDQGSMFCTFPFDTEATYLENYGLFSLLDELSGFRLSVTLFTRQGEPYLVIKQLSLGKILKLKFAIELESDGIEATQLSPRIEFDWVQLKSFSNVQLCGVFCISLRTKFTSQLFAD